MELLQMLTKMFFYTILILDLLFLTLIKEVQPLQQSSSSTTRIYRDAASNRDPQYILDMMETLMVTIDNRFKKMDIIDATHRFTLENMLKKMESIDNKITENSNNLASLISTIKSLDAKLKPDSKYESSSHTVGSKLQSLDNKIGDLSSKITQLKDNIMDNQKNESDLLQLSSERRHIVTTPDGKMLHQTITTSKLENDLESVKGSLRGLDSKLQNQSEKMANTITNLMQTIADIREAVLDSPADVPASNGSNSTASETGFASSDFISKPIKFERFGRKLRPLMHVIAKLDDIYTAIVNTRHSIDDTRQKSDQLLTRSYHTTQALTDVKYDLYYQTSKIIDNLGQVEQWLREQTGSASSLDPKLMNSELRELLDKVDDEVTKARITQKLSEFVEKNISGDDDRQFFTPLPPTKPIDEMVSSSESTFVTPQNTTNFLSNLAYLQTCPFQEHPGINCADLKNRGVTKSGIYYLRIKGTTYWFMKVYCEMETAGGGWTVIQRRDDYGEPHESFNRDWNEYKNGFGDLSKEFWLGNENIFMLTNQDEYTLRIDLEDFDGNKRYAEYSKYKMSSEGENYKLEIGGYDGTAGDSLNDPWYGSNLSPFSTYNRDNDRSSLNCASMLRGGWWWRSCGRGLNGLYLSEPNDLAARQGIVWFRWRGWDYNLKRAQMMIRPKEYQPENEQTTTQKNSETESTSVTTEILHNRSIDN